MNYVFKNIANLDLCRSEDQLDSRQIQGFSGFYFGEHAAICCVCREAFSNIRK